MTHRYYFSYKKSQIETPKRYQYQSIDKLPQLPLITSDVKQSWKVGHKEQSTNLGVLSFPGQLMSGKQKINQDAIIVEKRLNFYGVADGHGVNGERVSGFIRVTLPKYIEQSLLEPKETLINSILQTNNELVNNSKIETVIAGSTLCCGLIKLNRLYIANVGDSRCVLAKQTGNSWQTIELTKDQKPSREDEARRILKAGGRIAAQQDIYGNQVGPLRVWLKTLNAPGLAMTRAIGDRIGAQAGVIPTPEITEYELTNEDKILVFASDGIWDFLSSQEVVSILGQCYSKNISAELAAQKLRNLAVDAWKRNSLARDDITCVVLYL
ncbi:unnamed protein product [Paramecium primaurelia]|uniref:PPM-type phosphatase domain-containing protein n=1 Tax=Paramecium primaurelia TaxID=5886 RepID=A0A8S1LS67_PARPR|nr:unnamed protein product [Paramecium primaurelia]